MIFFIVRLYFDKVYFIYYRLVLREEIICLGSLIRVVLGRMLVLLIGDL